MLIIIYDKSSSSGLMDQNVRERRSLSPTLSIFPINPRVPRCPPPTSSSPLPQVILPLHGILPRPSIPQRLPLPAPDDSPPTPGSGTACPTLHLLRHQPRNLPSRQVVSRLSQEHAQVRIRLSRERHTAHGAFSDLPIVYDRRDLTLKGDGMALCVSKSSSPLPLAP